MSQETTQTYAPGLLGLLTEAMGVPANQHTKAISEVFSAGRQVVGTFGVKVTDGMLERDPETGAGVTVITHLQDLAWRKAAVTFSRFLGRGRII